VEQVGRPEEVYHVPATRFVADFVGEAAFVPGEVADGVLRSELGSFPLGDAQVGQGPVQIMLRPEDVVLEHDPGGDASVVARRFQGPVTLTEVMLPSGQVLGAIHSSQSLLTPGDRVRVSFEPDHLVLFRGDVRVAWVRTRSHTGTDLA
jgi:iron(III) transport system ATP-binding protein